MGLNFFKPVLTVFCNKYNFRKNGLLKDCPNSCRFIASKPLCSSNPEFKQLAALTWREECATGQCSECPDFTLVCPEERVDVVVQLPQWKKKFCEIKAKAIHSLFTEPVTLSSLVKLFNEQLGKLSAHIYRAAWQWEGYQLTLATLRPGCILMVVDYQMNGTILHKNSSTSSNMGANTAQFCIYPVYLAVCLSDRRVIRGGIIFLSKDLKHDRHQVGHYWYTLLRLLNDCFRFKYSSRKSSILSVSDMVWSWRSSSV